MKKFLVFALLKVSTTHLKGEEETVLPWARRLIDGSNLTPDQPRQRDKKYYIPDAITVGQLIDRFTEEGLLKQIEQSHRQYQKSGRLLDLPVNGTPVTMRFTTHRRAP
jgi:hypothetical protein